ncbi:cadherin domain-containing protein [Terricaulis silvestris]|uniref:Cyclolysin n=1 Tax=Terricaulis silvestris TaxID=2686094 RepID=A0A6I6MR00_9CAUL|nr:cadherin domain-containing protein [Terricaulis silvestris]QGZ96601.1 Cyclolysin [Terricaulis silvestris]
MSVLSDLLVRIQTASASVAGRTAVFYSGGNGANQNLALNCVNSYPNQYYSIHDTGVGAIGGEADALVIRGLLTRAEADAVWRAASTKFAMAAEGEVIAFVEGALPSRTFSMVELPILVSKGNVTINGIAVEAWASRLVPADGGGFQLLFLADILTQLAAVQDLCLPPSGGAGATVTIFDDAMTGRAPLGAPRPRPADEDSEGWASTVGIVGGAVVLGVLVVGGIIFFPEIVAAVALFGALGTAAAAAEEPTPPPPGASQDLISAYERERTLYASLQAAPELAYVMAKSAVLQGNAPADLLNQIPPEYRTTMRLQAMVDEADGPLVVDMPDGRGGSVQLTLERNSEGTILLTASDGVHTTAYTLDTATNTLVDPVVEVNDDALDDLTLISELTLPDGGHVLKFDGVMNGKAASYKVYRAWAPNDNTKDIVVRLPLYSADGKDWRTVSNAPASAPGHNWTIEVVEITNGDGSVTTQRSATASEGAPESAEIATGPELNISFAQIGSIFGSNLARLIPTDDIWTATLAGTLIGTIGLNLGQLIDDGEALAGVPAAVADKLSGPFEGFSNEFIQNLQNSAAGVISSILVADLIDAMGLEGTLYGDWLQTHHAAYLTQVITHLPQILTGDFTSLAEVNPANLMGGFLGAKLAAELVQFESIGGQIGAAVGSAIGTLYGADALMKIGLSVGGPVGAFIGAFVGYLLGGLIGSLFGGTPKSGAALGWNEHDGRFAVGRVWSKNGGSKDSVRAIASQVGEVLNAVIASTGARVTDVAGVQTGAYDTKGSKFIYKASASGNYAYSSKDAQKIINHGTFIALADLSERLIGGNVYVKRAVMATVKEANGNPDNNSAYSAGDFEAETLLGNIAVAQDFANYLTNSAFVNSLMAAQATSGFAATWLITLAQAQELGIDRRWKSDWLGGWAAFFDESFDAKLDGVAFAPSNVLLELDPETRERLFGFIDGDGAVIGVLGDTIDSGSKDWIRGTSNADTLTVANGSITLTSAHQLNGEVATPGAHAIRIAAVIDGGAGNDTIRAGDQGNDLIGGDGGDVLIGGALDDWMFGGEGADKLFAGAVSDGNVTESAAIAIDSGNGNYLEGGGGDDLIYGGTGSDWLNGGDGVDRLVGGAGGDILNGGAGDDRAGVGLAAILGGAGSDQYVFGLGYGKDVIFDESDPAGGPGGTDSFAARMAAFAAGTQARNWAGGGDYVQNGDVRGGEDAIVFAPGMDITNIVLKRSGTAQAPGNDLIVQLQVEVNGVMTLTGDELVIKDWFNQTRRVEWFRFADGEDIRIGDLSSFTVGTGGNDVIIGTSGADFVVAGAGDDTVYTLAGDDFGFGGSGSDFISGDGDSDMVAGGSGDDIVTGGTGLDTVFGDTGDDQVYGGADSDIIAGGKGADLVVTGAGNDVVRYNRGDGADTLIDEYVNNWETVFQNGVYVNGYALQSNGTVTKGGVVYFDGSEWLGRYDWVQSTNTLKRQVGAVSGAIAANSGTDTLEFGFGIDIQHLEFRRVGNDLDIAIRENDSDVTPFENVDDRILIKDWFAAGAIASIEKFVFTEIGTVVTTSWSIGAGTGIADTTAGGTGVDWMTGSDGDDIMDGAGGADILYGGNDHDTIKGGDGADVIYGGDGSDILNGGLLADQLFGGAGIDLASYANSTAAVITTLGPLQAGNGEAAGDKYNSIEGLEGSAFADTLTGNENANVLRGLVGADLLRGGAGDDTYEFLIGAGADTIAEGAITTQEIVSAAGVLASGYTVSWQLIGTEVDEESNWKPPYKSWAWYRLIVTQVVNGQTVEIYRSNDFADFEYYGNSVGAMPQPSPTVWPFSAAQWKNGVARTGNGYQVGREIVGTGEGGADSIEFGAGISLAQLSFLRENSNADLRITYGATDSVLISGQSTAAKAVETIHLDDGLVIDLVTVRAGAEVATANADAMFGNASANTLAGLAGDDILSGAAGDDTLQGGDGNDVLEGGAGADLLDGGSDEQTAGVALSAAQGTWGDTIRYVTSSAGVNIDLTSVDPANAARSLAFTGGDAAGDKIVRVGGYSTIEHVTGSQFNDTIVGDARHNRLQGLDGVDTISGRGGDDVIAGGAGNDLLYGEAGADNIIGGDGVDTVSGGDDDDVLMGDAGNDTLNGDAGNDMVVGGDGDDTVAGSTGDDTLAGGEGIDLLQGGDGNDQLAGEAGADTLQGGNDNDELLGGLGNDALQGGAGDDVYVFEAGDGADIITDTAGVNTIKLAGVPASKVWLARVGFDLKIGIIGEDPASSSITVANYFGSSSPGLIKSVEASDGTIYLAFAGPLITAMTAISTVAPASMPQSIANLSVGLWHIGPVAPLAPDQSLQLAWNTVLNGNAGAIDHDQDILANGYTLFDAADHGAINLNAATGAWTYTPSTDWVGEDSFKIKITDAAGHEVIQTVAVDTLSPTQPIAPTTPTIVSQPVTNVQDSGVNGQVVATLAATDLNGPAPSFRIKNGPSPWFEIVGNELRFKANVATLDYGTTPAISVDVEAWDGALASPSVRHISVNVIETNTAPTMNAQSFSVDENMPGAGQTTIGTLAASDLDDYAGNKQLRYELTGGDTSVFQVNAVTGELKLHGALNWEAQTSYSVSARVWDGGAVGQGLASSPVTITINVNNVNEAPAPIFTPREVYIPYKGIYNTWTELTFNDPDTYAPFQTTIASVAITSVILPPGVSATFTSTSVTFASGATIDVNRVGTQQKWNMDASGEDPEEYVPTPPAFDMVLTITDSANVARQYTVHHAGAEFGLAAPIVLDLDGDGLELSSIATKQIYFDMDGDGQGERTGWVGADDGILVLDRNGDGAITERGEIAFNEDVAGGQTDLEGLSSFDTNLNGRFDGGDERFADFRIWRDLNQDGVSQSEELQSLTSVGIASISLTIEETGAVRENEYDNLVIGRTVFYRADGSSGEVGDVMLAFVAEETGFDVAGALLPPIVFDLNGDGVKLLSRGQSKARFDADGDGDVERTGWFSAGDGVLALDRNGDGLINNGLEISFKQDLAGAMTDLEGLAAYDSDLSGKIDEGDAAFGTFLVWQDANGDGVSEAGELRSLADAEIASIGLTRTEAPAQRSGGNIVHAYGTFVRSDGRVGETADVSLVYDADMPATAEDRPSRTADERARAKPFAVPGPGKSAFAWMGAGGGDDNGLADEWLSRNSAWASKKKTQRLSDPLRSALREPDPVTAHAASAPDDARPALGAGPAQASSLHQGLGVLDRRVLHMVNAMSTFDVKSSADLARGGKRRDARVAELLTTIPDGR